MQLVKEDVKSYWKPNEEDWRDTKKQEEAKLDKRVQATFDQM